MRYRELGNTGLKVSEIGFGAEWVRGDDPAGALALAERAHAAGINIVDCWMADPAVRSSLGHALAGMREGWIIQGHVGSTWQDGQYVRTRDMDKVVPAFEDLLARLQTDYIDLGFIHYVDRVEEFHRISEGPFMAYMQKLLAAGTIRHIGLSTHNPEVGLLAAADPRIEMIMFSVNPAFDLMPASEDIEVLFGDYADEGLAGMDPQRRELYATCERTGTGITVMKGYAGGRLLDAAASPFGVALTPLQCIHYALTRPAVTSVMVGYSKPEHVDAALAYETASPEELDYASVLASAPAHAYTGQCTYCGHCAPCPKRIDIALASKFLDLALMQDEVPAGVKAHYEALDARGADCVACRACEDRCPFGVKVAERMARAAEVFGS